jgi:hypothetical protein
MRLQDIPLIDNHCHPMHRQQALAPQAYRGYYSETSDPGMTAEHVQHALGYMASLRLMAELLGLPPDTPEDELLEARAQLGMPELTRQTLTGSNTRGVIMDHGFPVDDAISYDEMEDLLTGMDCQMRRVWRLELIFERLFVECNSLNELVDGLTTELTGLKAKRVYGLKSVSAYRSGLGILPTSHADASGAFEADKKALETNGGKYRIDTKALEDYLTRIALKMASEQGIPVQFHTAFGDTEASMITANPIALRPVFEDSAFSGAPIVMLHCFPFILEVSYLAHVYGNAYFDLSYTVPVAGHYADRVYEDALSVAPSTKVLYGSDAPGLPDFFWLSGIVHRRALGRVLDGWVADGLSTQQAEDVARNVSYRNAGRLYEVTLPQTP